jgi:hypothetical protein
MKNNIKQSVNIFLIPILYIVTLYFGIYHNIFYLIFNRISEKIYFFWMSQLIQKSVYQYTEFTILFISYLITWIIILIILFVLFKTINKHNFFKKGIFISIIMHILVLLLILFK